MKNTFTIVLDDASTRFLDEAAQGDPNGFINRLLEQEKRRQAGRGRNGAVYSAQELMDSTPDAST